MYSSVLQGKTSKDIVTATGERLNSALRFSIKPLWLVLPAIAIVLAFGVALTRVNSTFVPLVIAALVIVNIVALRRDEITAFAIVVISIMLDWYKLLTYPFWFPFTAVVVALALIIIMFMTQSRAHPWIRLPYLWIWILLLLLVAAAIPRSINLVESVSYFITIFGSSVVMWIIGTQAIRDLSQLRRLLVMLTGFGTVVAIHTIIDDLTGVFLLATPSVNAYIISKGGLDLSGNTRMGSFLLNPDVNGTFLAIMIFLAAGLMVLHRSRLWHALYLLQIILMIIALLFTYSTASWIAFAAGLVALLIFIGRGRVRYYLLGSMVLALAAMFVIFPSRMGTLLQHAARGRELMFRLGDWVTALRVIQAYPLTGVGLGASSNYLRRAEPFRVPYQYTPVGHPHNSYLELAAFAGIPVLILFLLLLGRVCWLAYRNYLAADLHQRPLIGVVFVALVVLSVNSLGTNGWTLPPFAAIAWLILGGISSPALTQTLKAIATEKKEAIPASQSAEMKPALRETL